LRCGQRGIPAPVTSHWIGLDRPAGSWTANMVLDLFSYCWILWIAIFRQTKTRSCFED